jgi:hypothetical protein
MQSNARRQAKWRAKRNAEARNAVEVLGSDIAYRDLSQDGREAAVIRLMETPGATWSPGFIKWLAHWKPGLAAKRQRRASQKLLLPTDDLKLLPTDDLKLELADVKLQIPEYEIKLGG